MMNEDELEDLCKFIEVDRGWLEHVIHYGYTCGCELEGDLCKEWEAKQHLEHAEALFEQAKERMHKAKQRIVDLQKQENHA
jgi:hypothetical protein